MTIWLTPWCHMVNTSKTLLTTSQLSHVSRIRHNMIPLLSGDVRTRRHCIFMSVIVQNTTKGPHVYFQGGSPLSSKLHHSFLST